jgi:hypothetical protein
MADTEIETYNLWRYFKGSKTHQWACELKQESGADHGFKVVDYDHAVADSLFWDQVANHFESRHLIKRGAKDGDRYTVEVVELSPGDDEYFENAVRTIPNTIFGPERGAR